MKVSLKLFAIPAVLLMLAYPCAADTYLLGSFCTSAGCPSQPGMVNSPTVYGGFSTAELNTFAASTVPFGTTATYFADPGSIWAPDLPYAQYGYYVSSKPNTGPGNFSNIAAPGFYNYYSTFTLPNLPTGDIVGMLNVAADDTTDVWLNGILLSTEGAIGSDSKCADGVPNCRMYLGLFIHSSQLRQTNVLAFSVDQTVLYTGLNYNADITYSPEPNSILLLATGLAGLTCIARGRFSRSRV